MDAYPDTGVAVLDADACWTLLQCADVGRLAVSIAGGDPDIFPVNYVVQYGTIVFRTVSGSKLSGAVSGRKVAFEVDGRELTTGEAWSVVVKGGAAHVKPAEEMIDPAGLPLFPWHGGPKDHYVRIVPDEVSGRRFPIVDRTVWGTPLTPEPGAG
jgi:uncharacterized protein